MDTTIKGIPCLIDKVVLTNTKNGRVVTVPVYKCFTAPTAEQYAAAKGEKPAIFDRATVTIGDHELLVGTVTQESETDTMLVLMFDPEYKALGFLRPENAEQDKADVTAVYTALLMQGEATAYFRNERKVEIVPEDDPRAVTYVFDPMYQRNVYYVRASDRRNDVRRISKKLKGKFAYLKEKPTVSMMEGGTADAYASDAI